MCAEFDYTQRHSSFILQFSYYVFPTPNYLKTNLKSFQLLNHPLLLSTQAPFHGLLSLLLLLKVLSNRLPLLATEPSTLLLPQIQLQSNAPSLHRIFQQTSLNTPSCPLSLPATLNLPPMYQLSILMLILPLRILNHFGAYTSSASGMISSSLEVLKIIKHLKSMTVTENPNVF